MTEIEIPKQYALPFGDIPELELFADMSSLVLRRLEPGGTPRLELAAHSGMRADVERQGEKVVVHLTSQANGPLAFLGLRFGPPAHATLYLPDDLRARLHTEMGRVRAEDLQVGELEISSSAGALELRNVHGRLKLSTQAGKISGEGLAGSIDAETQVGAVQLSIDALSPGVHRALSQAGAVRVDLAPGLAVNIKAHTELGRARVSYPSQPDALAVLQLSTQMGAVSVRERGANWGERDEVVATRTSRAAPGPELRKVLDLVATGKLSAQDAEDLLRAMER